MNHAGYGALPQEINIESSVSNPIYTETPLGTISTVNSTVTPLAGDATFTGTWEDVSDYSMMTLIITTSHASATDGLSMQFSTDGVNLDRAKTVSVSTSGTAHTLVMISKYFRIVYTNGSTLQTTFRLQVKYNRYQSKELTSTLTQTISNSSDVQLTRSTIVGQRPDTTYGNVSTTTNNELLVRAGTQTIFGEQVMTGYKTIAEDYAPYGMINDQLVKTIAASGGTVTANSNSTELDFNITTTVGSYCILRSLEVIKYRPGYSNILRTSARMDTGVPLSLQFVGLGNAGSDLYFCQSGTEFGVRRSTDGLSEVRKLTITAAATGAETLTLTLNSVAYTITLSNAGGDLSFTAHEVENGNATILTTWNVEHVGDSVIFQSRAVGAKAGTYSFSSTGAATGTFATEKTGTALTTEFVAQGSWNGPFDTTGFDPTKNQLYEINYSWFGGSDITFSIYNPTLARFQVCHTMSFANTATSPSLSQPNMFIQRGVASLGSTTALTMTTACSMASTLGDIHPNKITHSISNSISLASSVEKNLFVIKNRNTINGNSNQSESFIKRISIVSDGNRPVTIKIWKNPTSTGADTTTDYNSYTYVDEDNSMLISDVKSLTRGGGSLIETFFVPKNGGINIEFDGELIFHQGDIFVVTAESSATNTVDGSINFLEDL